MLAYTCYNRAGGQGKSVLTRDLAAAHARQGHRVLIVDLDAQKGSVTNFYDIDYDKNDPEADRLTLHIMNQPHGEFDDLVHNVEDGVDLIPGHEELNELGDILSDMESMKNRAVDGGEFNQYAQLFQTLRDNDIPSDYDVLICDPNAKADVAYYSALYATRNVVIPAATTPKGVDSIDDVSDTASNFADAQGISIGNLGVIATQANLNKSEHQSQAETLRDDYDAVCYFKDLSVYDDASREGVSLFEHIEGLDRVRDSQTDVLPKYRTLLAHIMDQVGESFSADGADLWTGDDFWGDVPTPTEHGSSAEDNADIDANADADADATMEAK